LADRKNFDDAIGVPQNLKSSSEIPPIHPVAGRVFLALLGAFLVLIGSSFVYLMGRSYLRASEMRDWPEVPCVILSSSIEERKHDEISPTEYRQEILYGYEWRGQAFTGDHLTLRGSPWTSNRLTAEQRVAEFTVGQSTTCRVNPSTPSIAVLKPDSLAPGYSIWFPALFVVGGIGILVRAIRANPR
jgi:hypothetical protein